MSLSLRPAVEGVCRRRPRERERKRERERERSSLLLSVTTNCNRKKEDPIGNAHVDGNSTSTCTPIERSTWHSIYRCFRGSTFAHPVHSKDVFEGPLSHTRFILKMFSRVHGVRSANPHPSIASRCVA
jgi:hypothetical protein